MKRNAHSLVKVVLAVVLAAGVTGVASADDGGMGRFGDSYQYFASQSVDKAPSAWRQANPQGLSERQLQADSENVGIAFDSSKPVFDKTPSDFRLTHPNGLSEQELQALSSEMPAWHRDQIPARTAVASSAKTNVATR
jgi:hypothetical protein